MAEGAITVGISDDELWQKEFQYSQPDADKEMGPKGGDLVVDQSSLTIPPNSLADTQNLNIAVSMGFKTLGLPADMVPISPYLELKSDGKLRIPAKARVPCWFKASRGSQNAIKIYKRYRDEENILAWRELQNDVKVYDHDDIIEFEVDQFCGFIALIKDWYWGNGKMKLKHGLFQLERRFLSVVCCRSPESLFRETAAKLEKKGYKEIHNNRFVISANREVPIRMECIDPHLFEFLPQQRLLTPSAIKTNQIVQFAFILRHLIEPKDEADINYIVDGFQAPCVVKLPATKELSAITFEPRREGAVNIHGDVNVHAGDKGD